MLNNRQSAVRLRFRLEPQATSTNEKVETALGASLLNTSQSVVISRENKPEIEVPFKNAGRNMMAWRACHVSLVVKPHASQSHAGKPSDYPYRCFIFDCSNNHGGPQSEMQDTSLWHLADMSRTWPTYTLSSLPFSVNVQITTGYTNDI